MLDAFTDVRVVLDPACGEVRGLRLEGFTAQSFARLTDGGRLYGTLRKELAVHVLRLYRDPSRTSDTLVCEGRVCSVGRPFPLVARNDSGVGGQARLVSYNLPSTGLVVRLPAVEHER